MGERSRPQAGRQACRWGREDAGEGSGTETTMNGTKQAAFQAGRSQRQSVRYVIITPARNEGRAIEETILSVLRQTLQPIEWVIVDDGSRDETGEIIDCYAKKYSWISTVHRPDRGFRNPGGGVIEAFTDGYCLLKSYTWEYIVKLDADLIMPSDYFETCFEHFEVDPKLGIGGGTVYESVDGTIRIERNPAFHVRGATKIYRRACWDALGGLFPAPGWDTLDEVKANMLDWRTRTFPDVRVRQRRPTGSNDGSWNDQVKNGRADYICGYHPLFMLVKCLRRLGEKPYGIASLGLGYGYVSSFLKRAPQVGDRALIRYLRHQQLRRLLFAETIWK